MAKYVFDINKYKQKHNKSQVPEQKLDDKPEQKLDDNPEDITSTIKFNYDKLIDNDKLKNDTLINMDWDFLYALIGKSYKHLNK